MKKLLRRLFKRKAGRAKKGTAKRAARPTVKAGKKTRAARTGKGKARRAAKAPRARKAVAKRASALAGLEKVGEVTHYFPKVKAAAMRIMKGELKIGDRVYIKGHTTNLKQDVMSIQLDHVPIEVGKKGQEIGLLVKSRTRIGDSVYKL